MSTSGRDGTVTVNSGNIVLEMVTDKNYPTIACADFIINGGTVTASNNYFGVIYGTVKLNSGTLNVIGTLENNEAINGNIIMDKGALLTVSATSGILGFNGKILKADGLSDSDCFFVRYDKESEFAPVYDIKTALENKTYAEIKIETHEHSLDNYSKCICGYKIEKPVTPDVPTDNCDHLCHQSGFVGFIWKIVQLFWKLFKMNPVCECGAAHY